MASPAPTTILIGLSGPSSSGKTTLARLLRSVVNLSVVEDRKEYKLSLFVLHEDDFYKIDTEYVSRPVPVPLSAEVSSHAFHLHLSMFARSDLLLKLGQCMSIAWMLGLGQMNDVLWCPFRTTMYPV